MNKICTWSDTDTRAECTAQFGAPGGKKRTCALALFMWINAAENPQYQWGIGSRLKSTTESLLLAMDVVWGGAVIVRLEDRGHRAVEG